MYCTRIFKENDKSGYSELIRQLSLSGIKYEVVRIKKAHLTTTPVKQRYSAIVCWEENVQTLETEE
jgi:hypothetical protein